MRDYLKEKTFIRFPGGECYEILGMIGEGGSGLIYSAGKVVRQGEIYVKENSLRFALKECYPIPRQFNFLRMQSGEIVPENESEAAANYLRTLPIHDSQIEIEHTEDYSIFGFYLAPTYDFVQELRKHGSNLEVLEPEHLREDFKQESAYLGRMYWD